MFSDSFYNAFINLNEKQKKELQWGTLAYRSSQLHGSAPRRHEVEQYVKQSDLFMNHGLYPKMFEEQEQKHQSEEQKRAEALADRPERVTVKKKTVVPDSIARACAAETAAVSRETGGRAPTAQLRTGTTSPEAPEGEGTKTGGHDRNDG